MAETSDEPTGQPPSLQVQAIIRELKKSFREELEPIHDRLERLEGSQTNTPNEDHAENVVIPSFQGRTDLDAYLAWESKGLKQGSRSVEDYFKEMEMAMMRANIEEDREATMARFLNGLNTDIANVVELQHYVKLDEMVHMTIKVERQQCRKSSNREETESSKSKPPVADNGRGKQVVMQEHSRDIQCFKCLGRGHVANQCPNRRIVLLRENGEIDSDSEKEEQEPPIDDIYDDVQLAETGEVLVIKRSMTAKPTQDDNQRETIFHTRCLVNDKEIKDHVVKDLSLARLQFRSSYAARLSSTK
ncbi:hypothetical protein GQ457_06G000040 [Hibiscus cannabinus]